MLTSTMRGPRKWKIEQKLASLPLEKLPFDEVCELARRIAIRSCSTSKEKRMKPSNNRTQESGIATN